MKKQSMTIGNRDLFPNAEMNNERFCHRLPEMILAAWVAHGERAVSPEKAVRRWDRETPYAAHPTWCAMTVLSETRLGRHERAVLSQALLLHDVLEDTTAELPEGLLPEVVQLITEMTFESSDAEMAAFEQMSELCKLAKLYDKTSNLLDGSWMSIEKRERYVLYTLRLVASVEKTFGPLNITRIARAMCY